MAATFAGRNPNDNQAQINLSFRGKSIVDQIVAVHANIGPFQANYDSVILMPFAYLLARGETFLRPAVNRNEASVVIAVANVIAPTTGLTPLPQAAARARMRIEIISYLCNEINNAAVWLTVDAADWTTALAANGELHAHHAILPATLAAWDATTYATLCNLAGLTLDVLIEIMEWLIDNFSTPRLRGIGSTLYAAAWVSFAKRGTITDNKCNSVNQALTQAGCINPNLSSNLVGMIFTNLGDGITELTAGNVFGVWRTNIGQSSLRLRITLEQACMSGLTAVAVIAKAMRIFTTFNWDAIAALIHADFTAYNAALLIINNNPYYGFAKDLGLAKSTHFKSLAYVAKELLIAHGGPDYAALPQYGGWTRNPVNKLALDAIIQTYNPAGQTTAVAIVTATMTTLTATLSVNPLITI